MIGTYAQLQALLEDWLVKTGMTESVQDFITLAEGKLRTDPRVRTTKRVVLTIPGRTTQADVDLDDHGVVTLPTDYKSVVVWSINDLAGNIIMPGIPASFRAGSSAIGNRPVHFLVLRDRDAAGGEDVKGLLRPIPDKDAGLGTTLVYRASFDALSSTNDSNWLLKLSPAIYVYSALEQSAPYLKEDPRLPTWVALKEDALNSLAAFESGSEEVVASNVIKLHQQLWNTGGGGGMGR